MENNNQDNIVQTNKTETVMRNFENAIKEGNFYEAVANFMNLLSSGSQFDVKIDQLDLISLDNIDQLTEPSNKFVNHQDIHQNVINKNYEQIYKNKKIYEQSVKQAQQNYSNSNQRILQNQNNNSFLPNYGSNSIIDNQQNRQGSNQSFSQQEVSCVFHNPTVNQAINQFNFGEQIIKTKNQFNQNELNQLFSKLNINQNQFQNPSLDDILSQHILSQNQKLF